MPASLWGKTAKGRILMVCLLGSLLAGCAGTGGGSAAPQPLEELTLESMKEKIVAQWGTSDREVFKTSSFSESERFAVLLSSAVQRHLVTAYGQEAGPLSGCPTLKLLAIQSMPQLNDGSKREIWDIDACSIRNQFEMELTAKDIEHAAKHPVVLTPSF